MLSTEVTLSDQAVTELGDAGQVLLAELETAQADEATAKARVETAKAKIQLLLTQAGASEATVHGQRAFTWRPQVSRRLDQAKVRQVLTDAYGWSDEQIDRALYTEVQSRPFKRAA